MLEKILNTVVPALLVAIGLSTLGVIFGDTELWTSFWVVLFFISLILIGVREKFCPDPGERA